MSEPFFMVSLEVPTNRMMALGRRRGLPIRETDNGYLVHTLLCELFGDLAPKPFAIQGKEGRQLRILGYTNARLDELRERADALADPTVHNSCNWGTLAAKPMPLEWITDRRYSFEVRVCPVVRRSGAGPRGERPGREMDVFLAHLEKGGEDRLTRDTVYVDWLQDALCRSGGAEVEEARMTAFSLQRFIRRDRKRAPRQVPAQQSTRQGASGRPAATLKGTIRVADNELFARMLRRGVGRHRAFGFGMILLRATH